MGAAIHAKMKTPRSCSSGQEVTYAKAALHGACSTQLQHASLGLRSGLAPTSRSLITKDV